MRYLVVAADEDTEVPFTHIANCDRAEQAVAAAKNYVTRFPGAYVSIYEWFRGVSSKTVVNVELHYTVPERELPPAAAPGPVQNWTEDVENAALAKAERAGLTDKRS